MFEMCCHCPSKRIICAANEREKKKPKIACRFSYIPVRSIEAFNFEALISFCSIPLCCYPIPLFANYIEQLFGVAQNR